MVGRSIEAGDMPRLADAPERRLGRMPLPSRMIDTIAATLRLTIGIAALMAAPLVNAAPAAGVPVAPTGEHADAGEAARLSAVCSEANAIGTGLRAEYVEAGAAGGNPATVVKTDPTIDFGSRDEMTHQAGVRRIGSVRWTGWIKAHVTGDYAFDGGAANARIYVSNLQLAGSPQARPKIALAAGRYYPIRIEYDATESLPTGIRLQWTVPYGAHYVVPRQMLFLPKETVAGK
jgi:PA14 domain